MFPGIKRNETEHTYVKNTRICGHEVGYRHLGKRKICWVGILVSLLPAGWRGFIEVQTSAAFPDCRRLLTQDISTGGVVLYDLHTFSSGFIQGWIYVM